MIVGAKIAKLNRTTKKNLFHLVSHTAKFLHSDGANACDIVASYIVHQILVAWPTIPKRDKQHSITVSRFWSAIG